MTHGLYNHCCGRKPDLASKKVRKGQVLVLEEMMMFTLGVIIIAGVIFIFNSLNDKILEFVQDEQAEEINGYLKAYIASLDSMDCTQCHVTIRLPDEIGGEAYTILGEDSKKRILIHDNNKIWNEKNISVELQGISYADNMLRLEFDDGKVLMRGVNNY
ncbi:MAG: hypothetical protein V1718_04170 [archaeon]